MRSVIIAIFVLLVLGGCNTPEYRAGDVERIQHERAQEAAAALFAASEIDQQNPHPNRHTEIVLREISVAASHLPEPTEAQSLVALQRAYAALQADYREVSEMYAAAKGQAEKLESALGDAVETAARAEARLQAKNQAILGQTRWLTWAGIACTGIGLIFALRADWRIAGAAVGLGIFLNLLARVMAIVPDWAYYIFFGALTLVCLAVPAVMYWTYRVGLSQEPEPSAA